jgi:hypothetical protein
MDNLHYFSGLKMSEAKDFRLHKKNLLVWNVLVMNDLNRTIRLTADQKLNIFDVPYASVVKLYTLKIYPLQRVDAFV